MDRIMGKPTFWYLIRDKSNRAVQPLKMARGCLKFQILKVRVLYYPISENKSADQIRGYCEVDLRLNLLRIYAKRLFSQGVAHIMFCVIEISRF